ncbi:MAG TPA: MarR family transcriptional regulator [Chthoniobacterales bacterium]|jgi:DNA-binding MarR family transcriptional regulator|nr:MarR family transcriptional regulator [Chthoniobacterales bacterium]
MLTTEQRSTEQRSAPEFQAEAQELAEIVLQMQRRFILKLSEQLGHGSVSFPQYFLLGYLDTQGVITMSGIASKMGHTTAAATGLVDRLEKLGYVQRSHALDDRRKVMVRITQKGSSLVAEIRRDMVEKIMTLLREHLTAEEGRTWLQIYRKIADYCDKLPK